MNVNSVAQTKIFARLLTIPVVKGAEESSFKFINLSGDWDFFPNLKENRGKPNTLDLLAQPVALAG
ncbi:MAG: hypothetical protein OSB05_04480 [Akkermansiaceae bacterium]|nr:hypothetical protein [Akkermansiaceae bacterium]